MIVAVKELREKEVALEKAKREYGAARINAQAECDHPEIVEGKPRISDYLGCSDPPFRTCTECGYAEEGWGCGYNLLNKRNVPEVERDEAFKYVRRGIIKNENHSAVRSGTKTLKEILA